MEIFQDHESPENRSHWIAFGHHKLAIAGAPGARKLEVWANQARVSDLITLQRHDEMASWLPQECVELGISWHPFPLSGKHMKAPGDRGSLTDLLIWTRYIMEADYPASHIVVHCSAGLHRTGFAAYLMLRGLGQPSAKAMESIEAMRALTARELVRHTSKSGRLLDKAEAFFTNEAGLIW